MELMAVCYPELDKHDFDWMQSIRKKHDPQYSIVAPHFSIVFPVTGVDQRDFIDHCRNICGELQSFPFVIRNAVYHKAIRSNSWFVFLVPVEGNRRIIKMHDLLYSGIIENELAHDIPYIPHITIAQSKDSHKCRNLIDELNSCKIDIHGKINEADIILLDSESVRTLEKIPLKEKTGGQEKCSRY